MQDKKNTIHTEKKSDIDIATGKHQSSFLSKDHDLFKFSNSFKTRSFKISCSTRLIFRIPQMKKKAQSL